MAVGAKKTAGVFTTPAIHDIGGWDEFLFKCLLNSVVRHHLFLEGVSTRFGTLNHLDYLAVRAAFAFLQ